MKLTDHFSLDEFISSDTARRLQIDNQPPEHVVERMTALARHVLEPVRIHFKRPVFITSGYRSAELNQAIGGSNMSQHMMGEAADIVIPGIDPEDIAKYIWNDLDFDQLILEYSPEGKKWVHVSYTHRHPLRLEVLTYLPEGRYVPGLVSPYTA